jgi:hypothetical protein
VIGKIKVRKPDGELLP